jgi:hypothetical protein
MSLASMDLELCWETVNRTVDLVIDMITGPGRALLIQRSPRVRRMTDREGGFIAASQRLTPFLGWRSTPCLSSASLRPRRNLPRSRRGRVGSEPRPAGIPKDT